MNDWLITRAALRSIVQESEYTGSQDIKILCSSLFLEQWNTGFFERNKIQYFSEPKYVLERLLLDILKNKYRLLNNEKENYEIICCWWGFIFATLALHLHRHTIYVLQKHCSYLVEWCLKSINWCYLVKKGNI